MINNFSQIAWKQMSLVKSQKTIISLFFASALIFSGLAHSQAYIINGIGEYQEFNETSLLIKLDLESPASDSLEAIAVDTNKKLSFRIIKDKSPRLWSRIWIQNLSINNSPDTITAQTNDLIAMTQAIKGSLIAGDLVEFERIANDLTILRINGNEIEDYETPEFFEFLLSAFIGSIPPSSELKAALLSAGAIDNELNVVFDSLTPSSQRVAQIAGWGAPTPEPEPVEVAEVDDAVEDVTEEVVDDTVADVAQATEEVIEEVAEQLPEAVVEEVTEEIAEEETVEEEDAPILITAESLLAAQNYQRSVLSSVYQNIKYPSSALRRNREGSLRVAISIDSDGSLNKVEVIQNARYEVFDEAAVEAVEQTAPFGELPEGTLEIPMVLEIPISFQLQ